jgi:glycosyltransferase involved in cell wall biosynthesis
MHDNALAKALNARGHDCVLVPVYTPIRTDDDSVSIDQVFFGGINIYLQQKMPWLGYLPSWIDRSLSHPKLIRLLTRNTSGADPKLLGALTVSMLRGMDGNQHKEVRRLVDWLVKDVQPEVLLLTNLLIGGCIPEIKRRLNCPVVVTLQGDDIFFDYLPEPYRQQTIDAMRKLVPHVDRFVVHSQRYADMMGDTLDIPAEKFTVTPLGIELETPKIDVDNRPISVSTSALNDSSLSIGYLARLAPEKGLHLLVDAFVALHRNFPNYPHSLEIAGWLGNHQKNYWQEQQDKLNAAGLAGRYRYWGSVDKAGKQEFLRSIDVLSVPTTYEEPKGLYVLEAIAAGVPYLQPTHGAFPETHSRFAAGSLMDVDHHLDAEQFARHLSQAIDDVPRHREFIAQNQDAFRDEIQIDRMAERTETMLKSLLASS